MLKINVLFAAALLFSTSIFASNSPKSISLDMKLEINGKVVSHPRVSVLEGKNAEITHEIRGEKLGYSILVTPIINTQNEVQLSFVVNQSKDGRTKVLSRPRVVALNHGTASIEQSSEGSAGTLKLTVTPAF